MSGGPVMVLVSFGVNMSQNVSVVLMEEQQSG